ncbi:MAG: hypothetical protein NC122_07690 [Faecalibacterium sp.]|nr:hypothetical protein [Ruminococcus sp.]MCM1486075.1 hypothetical protein [Faecalibacterium sp.]
MHRPYQKGKVLSSWSGMRKYLEQEMLSESLRGRIRYNCTTYVGIDDCKVFEIFIDDKIIKRFSLETVNSYFIDNGYIEKAKPMDIYQDYWNGFFETLEKYPMNCRTEYTDEEFCSALDEYRNQPIRQSIDCANPIVKMFALLDRRIGVRTLDKIKENMAKEPEWLRFFYELRMEQ